MRYHYSIDPRSALLRVCIALTVIGMSGSAFAQRRAWTVKQPSVATRAMSLGIDGEDADVRCDFMSGVALVRAIDDAGEPTLTAIDLSSGRTLGRGSEPEGWNWASTVVGERFACCTSRGEILLLELGKLEIISRAPIQQAETLSIVFDKALWVAPGNWYALPSLQPVEKHSIVDPLANSRLVYGLGYGEPWMLSPEEAVIHGVVYGADLRPTHRFLGHFTTPVYSGERQSNGFVGRAANWRSREGIEELSIRFRGLQRIGAEPPDIDIVPPSSVALKGGEVRLRSFREGIFGIVDDFLLVVIFDKDNQRLLRGETLISPPPLIPWGGVSDPAPVQRADGREVREMKLQTSKFEFEVALDAKSQTYFASLNNARALAFAGDSSLQTDVARRVWRLSQTAPDATWEEVVAGYKQNNLNWLAPYASGIKRSFDGIPVELAVSVGGNSKQPFSFVVDFPQAILEEGYDELQAKRMMKPGPDNDAIAVFSPMVTRDKQTELPEIDPLPPAQKAPLPDRPDLDSVEGNWVLDSETAFKAMVIPLPICFRWIVLMGVIVFFNRGAKTPDKLQIGGGNVFGALLLSATWVFMGTGLVFMFDAAREQVLNESPLVIFGIAALFLMLDGALLFGLLAIASRRSVPAIAPVAATVFGILVVYVVALLALAFVLGVIAGLLKG